MNHLIKTDKRAQGLDPDTSLLAMEDIAKFVVLQSYLELKVGKSRDENVVLSGKDDAGTIVTAADEGLHTVLLDYVVKLGWEGSYTEEGGVDRIGSDGETPARVLEKYSCSIDPLDGTGDYKFGEPGTASGEGYSTLLTFTIGGKIHSGICIRPGHDQALIITEDEIHQYEIEKSGETAEDFDLEIKEVEFKRKKRENPNIIRINYRRAYASPKNNTNFPKDLLDEINEEKNGDKFVYTDAGGAGDALARLILGDLDVVNSGIKTDWKFWDTALFEHAIRLLGGKFTDYDGKDLHLQTGAHAKDLWHSNGVLASIGKSNEHSRFIQALNNNKDTIGFYYDPRKS